MRAVFVGVLNGTLARSEIQGVSTVGKPVNLASVRFKEQDDMKVRVVGRNGRFTVPLASDHEKENA